MRTSAAPQQPLLVLDDNPTWGLLVQAAVGSEPHIVQCLNGADAEAAYAHYLAAWVWMDISMPGLNGFTAARAILARWHRARILFVTQHDETDFRNEAVSLGVSGYVLKENLAAAVEWLGHAPTTHRQAA
jgi:DNA-binding NarL/FixJ family response regulator